MKREQLLKTLKEVRFLFGETYFNYEGVLGHIHCFNKSLVNSMITPSDFSFNALNEAHVLCRILMGELKVVSEARSGPEKPGDSVVVRLEKLGVGNLNLMELAVDLKFLSIGPDSSQTFEVNTSGTNLQWHLINLDFGELVSSDLKVLNRTLIESVDWFYDKLAEIQLRIELIMRFTELLAVNKSSLALRMGNLIMMAGALNRKLFDFFRLIDHFSTDIGVTVTDALPCVNDVD